VVSFTSVVGCGTWPVGQLGSDIAAGS